MTRPIGDKSQPWKGSRYLDSDGYVQIYSPEHPRAHILIREHILVMEKYLGCSVTRNELIHHISYVTDISYQT
jgi:hypothetical protein